MVSCVVNVLEATMNSVVSGWQSLSVSAMCVPVQTDQPRRERKQVKTRTGENRTIDVGHKVHFQGRVSIRLQRLGDHHWTKVGATDTNVHHICLKVKIQVPSKSNEDQPYQ
jgi:hypothetical protein